MMATTGIGADRGVPCGAFDSSPGVMDVGGLFFDFEPFRAGVALVASAF